MSGGSTPFQVTPSKVVEYNDIHIEEISEPQRIETSGGTHGALRRELLGTLAHDMIEE